MSGWGKAWSSWKREEPSSSPSETLANPRMMGAAPLRAPKRVCAASPPAPWQQGMAPNQPPTRFMAPSELATAGDRQ